jgi:ABC-2 type transport system ATP-binding protein
MKHIIQTEQLAKFYGKKRGVIDLDLAIKPGEVFGYLGPNGAGKTTTIRMLMGFIRPTSGDVEVLGFDPRTESVEIHRHVGYLPGEFALYEKMTGHDVLTYFAHLRGGVDWKHVQALVERLDLDLSRPIRTLSKGNKQKVGLVQALMHRPELLILDEPTAGLDPLVQQTFNQLVLEAKGEGRTIFLSSHVLAEVERIADRVGIIRDGQLVLVEEVNALKTRALRRLELHFAGAVPAAAFERLSGVRDVQVQDGIVECTVEGSVDALIKAAAQFEVVNIVSHQPDLEEIFLAYYSADLAGEDGGHSHNSGLAARARGQADSAGARPHV